MAKLYKDIWGDLYEKDIFGNYHRLNGGTLGGI